MSSCKLPQFKKKWKNGKSVYNQHSILQNFKGKLLCILLLVLIITVADSANQFANSVSSANKKLYTLNIIASSESVFNVLFDSCYIDIFHLKYTLGLITYVLWRSVQVLVLSGVLFMRTWPFSYKMAILFLCIRKF